MRRVDHHRVIPPRKNRDAGKGRKTRGTVAVAVDGSVVVVVDKMQIWKLEEVLHLLSRPGLWIRTRKETDGS